MVNLSLIMTKTIHSVCLINMYKKINVESVSLVKRVHIFFINEKNLFIVFITCTGIQEPIKSNISFCDLLLI